MSSSKSVLIIGGSGVVGSHLALKLRDQYKVYATYREQPIKIPGVTFFPFDLVNRNWVKRLLHISNPDIIIYCAGKNDIQWAEQNSRDAEYVHTSGPANIIGMFEISQPRFIYISNGYVFDGHRGNYHEGDTVLPDTTLGRLKLNSENVIKNKALNYLIIRCSHLFGRGNGYNFSFIDKIRFALSNGTRIDCNARLQHNPAPLNNFSDFAAQLIESGPKNKIIHYGGLTKCTDYEFAKAFARRFKLDENLISPIEQGEKPFDYSLNFTYACQNLKVKPLLLQEGFDLLEQYLISSP